MMDSELRAVLSAEKSTTRVANAHQDHQKEVKTAYYRQAGRTIRSPVLVDAARPIASDTHQKRSA